MMMTWERAMHVMVIIFSFILLISDTSAARLATSFQDAESPMATNKEAANSSSTVTWPIYRPAECNDESLKCHVFGICCRD
ncbi:hypothetical protein LINPERPRIM_LOCUS39949 [Linum perenne]